MEVTRLTNLQLAHEKSQKSLAARIRYAETRVTQLTDTIATLEPINANITDTHGDAFTISIAARGTPTGRRTFTERAVAGQILAELLGTPYGRRWADADDALIGLAGVQIGYDYHPALVPGGRDQHVWYLTCTDKNVITMQQSDNYKPPTPQSIIATIENLPRKLDSYITQLKTDLAEAKRTIEQGKPLIGAPFAHADDLHAARERYELIQEQIKTEAGQQTITHNGNEQQLNPETTELQHFTELAQSTPAVEIDDPLSYCNLDFEIDTNSYSIF
jgi:hypothetical protein